MSKMTVSWYEKNLLNWDRTLEERKARLFLAQKDLERSIMERDFQAHQIAEAKRRGLTEFDSDRFCVKRKKQ